LDILRVRLNMYLVFSPTHSVGNLLKIINKYRNTHQKCRYTTLGFYIEQWNYCMVYGKRIGQTPCSTEHSLSCHYNGNKGQSMWQISV